MMLPRKNPENKLSSSPIYSAIQKAGDRFFLETARSKISYSEFARKIAKAACGIKRIKAKRLALQLHSPEDFYACLIAGEMLGKSVILLSARLSDQDVKALIKTTKAQTLISDQKRTLPVKTVLVSQVFRKEETSLSPKSGEIILTTSGSTGAPKGVLHTWQSLLAAVSVKPEGKNARWFLTYDAASFAGLQIFFHAVLNQAALLIPGNDIARSIETLKPTHVSATPSFWRKLLVEAKRLKKLSSLRHITLGGEAITQDLLDQLVNIFPKIAVTQIYASTEMGACFFVRDKKAGLPISVLKSKEGVQAKILNHELWIRSPRKMKSYIGKKEKSVWFATGDLVKVSGGRIYFTGRKQNTLNVGGFKVYPQEVEEAICRVPGVVHARVYGEKSALLGQIVVAEVEIKPGIREEKAQADILRYCQKKLARPKVPRMIEIKPLNLTAAGKISRRI